MPIPDNEKPHLIVGTAGHIDHGKSALVRALTGIDPDTLPEEKERGMTIELGFVFLDDPGAERQVVFIDVPGHEKFVKTMVAGATNVDAVLFVIAADEGISVQTREHFDILRLLSAREGLIALTKSDLVDTARIEELSGTVRHFVKGTFLETAPILPVSALKGDGLPELAAALRAIGPRVKPREDCGYFRLPLDRVFIRQGFGTVVAGTVLSGQVKTGDVVEVLPEKLETRIRGVQVHHSKRESSSLGRRTAVNLQDLDKDVLRRGQCLAVPGFLEPTTRIDARLHLLPDAPRELKTRDRVRFHIGTDEVIARVVLLEKEKLVPGASMLAQFVLESPTVALYRDRFIIRTFSPVNTIGGGEVLNTAPARHKRFDEAALAGIRRFEGTLDEAVFQYAVNTGARPVPAAEISLRLGKPLGRIEESAGRIASAGGLRKIIEAKGDRFLTAEMFAKLTEKAAQAVSKFFAANPQKPAMTPAEFQAALPTEAGDAAARAVADELVKAGRLVRVAGGVTLPGHEARFADREQALADKVEAAYRRAGFEPPLEDDVCRNLGLPLSQFRKIMGALIQQGRLVRLDPKVTMHREAFDKARASVLQYLNLRKTITIAETKDILKVSRKYACAVLEYLDKTGLTRRDGDAHRLK